MGRAGVWKTPDLAPLNPLEVPKEPPDIFLELWGENVHFKHSLLIFICFGRLPMPFGKTPAASVFAISVFPFWDKVHLLNICLYTTVSGKAKNNPEHLYNTFQAFRRLHVHYFSSTLV